MQYFHNIHYSIVKKNFNMYWLFPFQIKMEAFTMASCGIQIDTASYTVTWWLEYS